MKRKLLAVGCACLLAVTALTGCGRGEPDPKEEGGMLTLEQVLQSAGPQDLTCPEYDLAKYTASYRDSQIIYNETVMFVRQDGKFTERKLLYRPAKVLEVRNYALDRLYEEGRDYQVTADGIQILPGSAMPVLDESDFYVEQPGSSDTAFQSISTGKYLRYDEGSYFPSHQVCVTYVRTEAYYGPEAEASGKLTKTLAKLRARENLKIVFYGDSLMAGCNASGFSGYAPHMPMFSELVTDRLKEHYGYTGETAISSVNTAVGGWLSETGKGDLQSRVLDHQPDLVVLGFGGNDGTFGVSAEAYGTNMVWMIDKIKRQNPDCEILLMSNQCMNEDATTPANGGLPFVRTQNELFSVLGDIASGYSDVVYVNTTAMYYDFILQRKQYCDILASNMGHPSDFLCRAYAQWILHELI